MFIPFRLINLIEQNKKVSPYACSAQELMEQDTALWLLAGSSGGGGGRVALGQNKNTVSTISADRVAA